MNLRGQSTLVVALVLTASLVLPRAAFASGVSLSPTRSILNTLPDQKLEVAYSLNNTDDTGKKFKLEPAQLLGEDIVTDSKISKIDWITLDKIELELAAKSSTDIKVIINVPADATANTYRFIVIGNEISSTDLSTNGTGINLALGFPIEVNVLRELPKAALDLFLDVSPSFSLENKFNATVSLKNDGNITLYPTTYLKVFGPRGDVVFQEVVNDQQHALPAKNSTKSEFGFTINLDNLFNATGEFTAEVITFDNALQISTKQIQKFVYIPGLLVIGAVAGIILLVILVLKIMKQFQKRLRIKKLQTQES